MWRPAWSPHQRMPHPARRAACEAGARHCESASANRPDLIKHCIHACNRLIAAILHAHTRSGGGGLLQRFCQHDCNVLAVEMNVQILQQRCTHRLRRPAVGMQFQCLLRRDDCQHTRHRLGRRKIETHDDPCADRALHQHRVHDIRHLELRCVASAAVTFSLPSTRSMPCPVNAIQASVRPKPSATRGTRLSATRSV
jgi:hypothetical protein